MLEITATIEAFNPTENYLLCEPVEEASESAGGIIIPDSAKVPLTQGIVLKAGSMCDSETFCEGRLIIFRLHTESRVNIDGKSYILVEPVNVHLTGPVLKKELLGE
jgi:chaperonin GroES